MSDKTKADNMEEVIKAIGDLFPDPKALIKRLNKVLLNDARRMQRFTKKTHDWTDRTGLLNRSHYIKTESDLMVLVGNSAPYSRFLHDGTGIHGYKGVPFVMANGALNNGIKPMDWLNKTWNKELPKLKKDVNKEILKAMGL